MYLFDLSSRIGYKQNRFIFKHALYSFVSGTILVTIVCRLGESVFSGYTIYFKNRINYPNQTQPRVFNLSNHRRISTRFDTDYAFTDGRYEYSAIRSKR